MTADRFFVETWGCQMNQLDSQRMVGLLMRQNMMPTRKNSLKPGSRFDSRKATQSSMEPNSRSDITPAECFMVEG